MGKYDPLAEFLRKQPTNQVRMTFAEIERIVGVKLPPSAHHQRAWWSNNASNNVMTKVWLAAGFRSEQVDLEARKLTFRRVENASKGASRAPAATGARRHPMFGALKGLMRIVPGTDLNKPADPTWGRD